MWICDAGQLYDSISDNWCGIGIANVSEILEFIKYAPTIDPETLPIVRQLREELARVTAERDAIKKNPPVEIQADAFALAVELAKVTAERDAAVEQLHGYCFACKHYTPYHNDGLCATCKHGGPYYIPFDTAAEMVMDLVESLEDAETWPEEEARP